MTADLRDLFAAAADDERAAARPLDVDELLTRAHRRRTVHATTYSAIGVGVAAAVTLGAISADGLWREEPAVPPATQEPTSGATQTPEARPTATPTATPTPTPTEVAWGPSWDLCGMPAEDLYERDDASDGEAGGWWLAADWPWETSVPVDAPFPLELRAYSESQTGSGTADVQLVDVVAVAYDDETHETGAVAGVAAVPVEAFAQGQTNDDDGLPLDAFEMSVVSCAASPLTGGTGALDTTLPDGHYLVVALADITPEGGETMTSVSTVGHLGEVEPVEPWAGVPPEPQGAIHYLAAGAPLRLTADQVANHTNTPGPGCQGWGGRSAPNHDASVLLTGTAFLRGDELIVRMTLTNRSSADLSESFVAYPFVLVTRDGQNLGSARLEGNAVPPGPFPEYQQYDVGLWPAGQAYDVEFPLGRTNCLGEPWAAGTYDVTAIGFLMAPSPTTTNWTSLEEGPFATQVG